MMEVEWTENYAISKSCRYQHFLQKHPKEIFRERMKSKKERKLERKSKKRERKKLKRKRQKKRKKLEKMKEEKKNLKNKRRTVGPIEFHRDKLPEIPTYDEINLLNQIENYNCLGENKMKIHVITNMNGTFLIRLELCWIQMWWEVGHILV